MKNIIVKKIIPLKSTTQYASGDNVGGYIPFDIVTGGQNSEENHKKVIVEAVTIGVKEALDFPCDIFFLSSETTNPDNGAFNIAAGSVGKYISHASFIASDFTALAATRFAHKNKMEIPLYNSSSTREGCGILIRTNSTITFAASTNLIITIYISVED